MHFNIQGLSNKIDELSILLEENCIDICCITEHWLKKNVIDCVGIEGYKLIASFNRFNFLRGGACIYARSNLNLRNVNHNYSLEKTFETCVTVLPLSESNSRLFIICIYRSPNSDENVFLTKLYDLMTELYISDCYYIMCGDINVNMLNCNNIQRAISNLFFEFGMRNVVLEPTRINALIDVIFTDLEKRDVSVIDSYLSDHTFQVVELQLPYVTSSNNPNNISTHIHRDFSDSNVTTFINTLKNETWSDVYRTRNFDNKFNNFYNTLMFHFNTIFPLRKRNVCSQKLKKPWYTQELRNIHRMLCEMCEIVKSTENENILVRYRNLKRIYADKKNIAKKTYNNDRLNKTDNISKETWKIVNESRNKNSENRNLPQMLNHNGNEISGYQNIAEVFNKFFLDFNKVSPTDDNVIMGDMVMKSFFLSPTSPSEIKSILHNCAIKPAPGLDGVTGTILSAVSDIISTPLCYLINESFLNGKYPTVLKVSKSVPVFKNKGSRNDVGNYRNICLPSQFSKVFDVCFYDRLMKFLEINKYLVNCQHGFRKKRSTMTAINDLLCYIYELLNNKHKMVTLFFDLSRAFDMVDHQLLLRKIYQLGVRGFHIIGLSHILQTEHKR